MEWWLAHLTFFRIYALYREHRLATAIPGLLFLVWVALEGYAMTRSESEHT
jgi:hypothetical protein